MHLVPRAEPQDDRVGHDARDALHHLVDEHGGQLYSLGLRFCGNRTEAEDLVQEVFLQAIAARVCQRMHRKRAGEPERIGSLDELLPFGDPLIAAIPGELEDALQLQIRKEARERVEIAITSLPDEFRVPLILKEIVGFTVPQVAQILGIEEGTARSRVHRARLKLRATVDAVIPRGTAEAPSPAYSEQTCLDLLDAKQEALDRGVPFDSTIICERCRSVFASLDLTLEACRELAGDRLPAGLRDRLVAAMTPPRRVVPRSETEQERPRRRE
jgi:RNA polymerase sigma-70 factor (ECF subfamily)